MPADNTTPPSPIETLDPGWAAALAPVLPTIERLSAELAAEGGYLPAGSDVLRAFTYPFDRVKVLIVGQDPYPTPGHSMGLAFSVQPGVKPPRSLVNIFRELVDDEGVPVPTSGDLTPWARQGVCLLNRVLTVGAGDTGSHRRRGWEEVTACAIDALAGRPGRPLVAVLWGRDAQKLAPSLTRAGVPVIESAHPSPLSARRGFFGSHPFSRVNEALEAQGAEPVDWRLP